jgi:carbamoyl-phosphate synthase small subunit
MIEYTNSNKALILLQDGTIFFGKALGVDGTAYGELCFNTGMTGYQEIFTDPSYFGQLMVTTNAHIGNYGVNEEEMESESPKIAGLICKNFNLKFSRPAATNSLQNFFSKHKIVAISDVDTRALVSHIRDNGAMNAVISTNIGIISELKKNLDKFPSMKGLELASKVSTSKPYFYGNPKSKYKISALDLGIKKNILRNLSKRDAYIKVFPYNSSFKEMSEWKPDGYFISNGPGDPEPLKDAIQTAKDILQSKSPLFGICLGHQIIALANGISTYKMHNGHRGINHPVKNLITGKGEITSQNHGFAISRDQTESNNNIEITHVHLNDDTIAGIKIKNNNCFSVQYHPEASPGPHDSNYLFDQFIEMIKIFK